MMGSRQLLLPEYEIPGMASFTVGDFWAWGFSDVLSNANRAVFAEFLVGAALGVVDRPRVEWDASDFKYRERLIEVKSSAFLQSWPQLKPSRIIFGIAKKKAWFAATNEFSPAPIRAADVFVFCLLGEKDSRKCNPLDVALWEFYIIPCATIEARFGEQKSAGLGAIRALCEPVSHREIKGRIDACIDDLRGAT